MRKKWSPWNVPKWLSSVWDSWKSVQQTTGSPLGPMKPGQGKERTCATECRQAVLNCQHCLLCNITPIRFLSQEGSHTSVNSAPHDCPKFCRAPLFTLFPEYNRKSHATVKHSASDASIFFSYVHMAWSSTCFLWLFCYLLQGNGYLADK